MRVSTSKIKEVFAKTLEIPAGIERDAYLHQVCDGDEAFLGELKSLLEAHDEAPQFLSLQDRECAVTRVMEIKDTTPQPQIGGYQLRERLGEGGMGIVYVAQQIEPASRLVALKVIKPGMDTQHVLARFRAEQQALALMSHPNIAKVLDGGTTEAGRPYFVMELVRGIPINEFCDRDCLSVEDRVRLFIKVCFAVQHAHLKGIIHRDLKPSNVLVEGNDVEAVPKVIDFGIAKALNQQLTEQTIYTQMTQLVGTPEYMSPEQARLSESDIDTRSDLYSLGVMLYELLTGSLPYLVKSEIGLEEIRRVIRENEPLRPSQQLSSHTADEAAIVSRHRRSDPKQLRQTVSRELDWIVLKSLEKDRTRRYQSATELAQDLQRFLRHEPVEVCPPSPAYRFRKFLYFYRGVLTTAAIILVTALLGLSFSLRFASQANESAFAAMTARKKAEQHAQDAELSNARLTELLYATNLKLAAQFWKERDIRNMSQVLKRHAQPMTNAEDPRGFEWYYLHTLVNNESEVLDRRDEQACLVRYSHDAKYLLLGWTDGRIDLLDPATFQKRFSLQADCYFVYGCDFQPNGTLLAVAGDDGGIYLWDLQSRKLIRRIPACQGHLHRVFFNRAGDTLISSGEESRVRFWDVQSGRATGEIGGFDESVHRGVERRLDVSPDRQRIAIGDGWENAGVYDLASQDILFPLEGITVGNVVEQLRFSHDGRFLAGGTNQREVHIWDATDGQRLAIFPRHCDEILSLAFHPTDTLLASGDRAGVIHLWNPTTGTTFNDQSPEWKETFQAHDDRVLSLDFSLDGRQLVTGSRDNSARLWKQQYEPAQVVVDVKQPVDVSFLNEGQQLLVGCRQSIDIWDCESGELRRVCSFDESLKRCTSNQDGTLLATSHDGGILRLWDTTTGQLLSDQHADARAYDTLTLSRDGTRLLGSLNAEETVELWDLKDRRLTEPSQRFDQYEFGWLSQDGELIALYSLNELHLYDANNGDFLQNFQGHTSTVQDVDFSLQRGLLATASSDRSVILWDRETGEHRHSILAHKDIVKSLCISPDRKTIVSGDLLGKLIFSHVETGSLLLEVSLVEDEVRGLEFSPQGDLLAVVYPTQLVLLRAKQAGSLRSEWSNQ